MSAQENFIKFINIEHYRVKFETSSCSSKSFEKLFFFISHVELPLNNKKVNALIARELSGFTCTRSLTMNSKFFNTTLGGLVRY